MRAERACGDGDGDDEQKCTALQVPLPQGQVSQVVSSSYIKFPLDPTSLSTWTPDTIWGTDTGSTAAEEATIDGDSPAVQAKGDIPSAQGEYTPSHPLTASQDGRSSSLGQSSGAPGPLASTEAPVLHQNRWCRGELS